MSIPAGIEKTAGTFGLGVIVSDFDNDGWPDIYVANDSTSSALYKNNHDGTFKEIGIEVRAAYSPDGKSQAGMGVSVADYDCDGAFDLIKTNFAGDTTSLYRNSGNGGFQDMTFQSGLGRTTRFLGWGASFVDFDNDGWPDICFAMDMFIRRLARAPSSPVTGSEKWHTGTCAMVAFRRCQRVSGQAFLRGSRDGGWRLATSTMTGVWTSWLTTLMTFRNFCIAPRPCTITGSKLELSVRSPTGQVSGRESSVAYSRTGNRTGRWMKFGAVEVIFRKVTCEYISG